MGKDIHVRIVKRDRKTNEWKQIKLYTKEKDKFKVVDIYPFRSYELFNILSEDEDDGYAANGIITEDLPESLKQEIEDYRMSGCYDFKEITLADIKLYLKNVPKVRDYDNEEIDSTKTLWKDNPVLYFVERVEQYMDFADPFWDFNKCYSDIRIIYWFDC